MTRGFITLATGDEKYYRFARNLLMSYRLYTDDPMPFAIACDRENAVTALFDQVILLKDPQNSFWDKFQLFETSPFDEAIFIDADCLAYKDLNAYWDYFAQADDFSGSGTNYPLNSQKGLFQINDIGEHGDRVRWKPDICGGLYFIRKGPTCSALYRLCQDIIANYDAYRWPDYCAPKADEPVLCLAMAVLGLRATEADPTNYGIPWEATSMEQDIFTGKCRYATDWHPLVEGKLIHFSTRYCMKPVYLFEEEKLNLMLRKHLRPGKDAVRLDPVNKLLYQYKLRYGWLWLKDFSRRAFQKLLRIAKKALDRAA